MKTQLKKWGWATTLLITLVTGIGPVWAKNETKRDIYQEREKVRLHILKVLDEVCEIDEEAAGFIMMERQRGVPYGTLVSGLDARDPDARALREIAQRAYKVPQVLNQHDVSTITVKFMREERQRCVDNQEEDRKLYSTPLERQK